MLCTANTSRFRLVIVINPKDNVATALTDLEQGTPLQVEIGSTQVEIVPRQPIAFGHKIALTPLAVGDGIIKYGEVIGRATRSIKAGDHVHVHNVESQRGRGDLFLASKCIKTP